MSTAPIPERAISPASGSVWYVRSEGPWKPLTLVMGHTGLPPQMADPYGAEGWESGELLRLRDALVAVVRELENSMEARGMFRRYTT